MVFQCKQCEKTFRKNMVRLSIRSLYTASNSSALA